MIKEMWMDEDLCEVILKYVDVVVKDFIFFGFVYVEI